MRLKNIFRNSFFSILSQVILIAVGFFSQRVMNLTMGEELVGMNSVISNILAILSVSEMGIASAVVYHLYRALAEQNEEQIAGLMNLYRKAYGIFASVITVLGLCVLPFVHLFLNENSFSIGFVRLVYLLWLVRTVLSYLLSYKRSILIADQKEYIVSILTLFANVLNYSMIIVLLQLTKNYPLVLVLNIVVEAAINLWISAYVDKKYPYLRRLAKSPMEKNMFQKVLGDIKNIFVTRLSSKLLVSTDSLIISGFISVGIVGLYSNYCLITQSIINIMLAFMNALQPSVGNLFIEENREKDYQVLRQISFVFFLVVSFSSVCLFSLMTPFVTDFWLTNNYELDMPIVLCCVVNYYMMTIGLPLQMVMSVTGLFKKERNLSILVAVFNLGLSLLLVKPFGVVGVQIGTFAAYLIQIIYRIRVFFKEYLQMDFKIYVREYLEYGILTVVETALAYMLVSSFYREGSVLLFAAAIVVCVLVPCVLNLLLYSRSWRWKSILNMGKGLLGR